MPRPVAPPSPALSLRDRVSSIKRLIVPNNNKSTPDTPNKKEGTFYFIIHLMKKKDFTFLSYRFQQYNNCLSHGRKHRIQTLQQNYHLLQWNESKYTQITQETEWKLCKNDITIIKIHSNQTKAIRTEPR